MKYDQDDSGLAYLAQCIRENIVPNIVGTGSKSVLEKQSFIIQWEMIQSLETGILFMLGLIHNSGDEIVRMLDTEIVSKISFSDVWHRKEDTVFDLIFARHEEKGIIISQEHKDYIKNKVFKTIQNDPSGLLYSVSPFLVFLNALINLYSDRMIKKMILVIPKEYTHPANEKPFKIMAPYFPQDESYPIYIDITEKSFCDYILSFSKKDLDESVIVTDSKELLEKSVEADIITNASFVFPECERSGFDLQYQDALLITKPANEYILYTQKALLMRDKNKKPF